MIGEVWKRKCGQGGAKSEKRRVVPGETGEGSETFF